MRAKSGASYCRPQNGWLPLEGAKASILTDALLDLALIIVVTVGVFIVLRRFAKRLYRRIGAQADGAGFLRSAMLALGSVVIDAGVVLLAWGLGYLVAVAFIGEYGAISTRQAALSERLPHR